MVISVRFWTAAELSVQFESNGTDKSNGAGRFQLTKSDSSSARLPGPQIRQFVEYRRQETTGASLFDR